ncbi:hypothetical protein, partial [Halorubellus sp. PRR65]|uniref:hypothetical protein n=1 Tax=Halorubellus sp. PRR65 TaxID=3098148 RepID=UPI002B2599A5
RTLCKDLFTNVTGSVTKIEENPIITIASSSTRNVTFSIKVDYQQDFFVELSKDYEFTITPSEPLYFFYNFSTNNTHDEEYSN